MLVIGGFFGLFSILLLLQILLLKQNLGGICFFDVVLVL